ncbi:hypothetical protein [Cedecea davisae]|uniref:hypothetical protein n=1 Tax=Cedecea davisae TaxID=158484 RepID=UPI001D09D69B|nr:hypothetical protein [Cedecea davisae]
MENNFLKQIQQFLADFESAPLNPDLPRYLADYLFSHQQLLDDAETTLTLINTLGDWLDGIELRPNQLYLALYLYWISAMTRNGIEVFYFGDLNHLQFLGARFSTPVINNLYFLSAAETNKQEIDDFYAKIAGSVAPFVIYDPQGLKLALAVEHSQAIACLSFFDLLIDNFIPASPDAGSLTHLLAKPYCDLANPQVKTAIIGNSYSFYGFPETLLEHSVNVSTHSLGLKQAQQLTRHILDRFPHIENFVYCLGFFDLYCDLLKSKDDFNQQIIHVWSQLNSHYQIKEVSESAMDGCLVFSRLAMPSPAQGVKIGGLEDLSARDQVCDNSRAIFASTGYLPVEQQQQAAQQRGVSHSKSVRHHSTLNENLRRVTALAAELEQRGKQAVWLTPPFPSDYVEHLDEDMKSTHRRCFAGLESASSRFIDLSENQAFRPEDFRDGDHLNFTGASRMVAELRRLKVVI